MKRDAKESAKEIRKVLGQSWASVKFSVRVKRYAGGSSVDIEWTDGPTQAEVQEATDHLKGYDNGYYNEYIATTRYHSREAMEAAAKAVAEHYGVPVPEVLGSSDNPYIGDYTDADGEALCDRIHRATWRVSLYDVDITKAFDEAYPNERSRVKMSENKHAPGPWEVGPDRAARKQETAPRTVCVPGAGTLIHVFGHPCHWQERQQHMEERDANAHLIAASPELLAACKMALAWIDNAVEAIGENTIVDSMPNNCGGRIQLRDAIAKAEGK